MHEASCSAAQRIPSPPSFHPLAPPPALQLGTLFVPPESTSNRKWLLNYWPGLPRPFPTSPLGAERRMTLLTVAGRRGSPLSADIFLAPVSNPPRRPFRSRADPLLLPYPQADPRGGGGGGEPSRAPR